MHIGLLYQHYLRQGEAGHSRLNEYARLWHEMGHQVSVITGQTGYLTGTKAPEYRWKLAVREQDGPIDVHRCYVPASYNRSFVHRTWGYLSFAAVSALVMWRQRSPDVLLVSSPPLTIGLAALAIKSFRRVPMVFEVRDLWPESAITTGVLRSRRLIGMLSWLERRCYGRSAFLNVLTPAFKDNIVARGLMAADRIANIQAGVNLEDMHPSKASQAIREQLGWGARKVVLYTGAIGRANRLEQLVETARVLASRPDVLIAVVGAGMEEPSIRQRIAEAALTNIVLHGARAKVEMAPIIASADVCIAVLMRNDTFKTVYPNKVFDYMACGRPVVLGIDGIIRELVERIDAGIYAEPENPDSLAAAIVRLLDDPERAGRCGQNGRRFVECEFSRERMAAQYADLLTRAAGMPQ